MGETLSCLFKLAGDSLLAILTYICEINYQFILCHLATDLGVVLWKLADSKKDSRQDSIVSCTFFGRLFLHLNFFVKSCSVDIAISPCVDEKCEILNYEMTLNLR